MGACASKFTVLKNASTAPPPAVKYEVEPKEVNLVEEMAVEKDDSPAEEDEAKRRQSLGHLLQEGEEKKGTAESDGKASEVVKHDDAAEVKAPAPIADGLKSKCVEEEILANQNVEMEAKQVEDVPADTVNLETTEKPQGNEAVEKPETLVTEKTEAKKPASDEGIKKEENPAVATKLETTEKTPETLENEITGELNPACDAEKETEEKSTEIVKIETPEKKLEQVEVTEEKKPASEAEKKNPEAKPCEISDKKPESPEMEKSEKQKEAANTDKSMISDKKLAEKTEAESSDKVEDKHVMEPLTAENHLFNKTPETSLKEQKPVSDAEKPNADEK